MEKFIRIVLLGLGAIGHLYGVRQRVIITNNSNARVHICTSTTNCNPLARPWIDPQGHDNLYVPFANGVHKFNLFLETNYQSGNYVLDYQRSRKAIILLRDNFELESFPCALGLGSKDIPLTITPDFNLIFDTTWKNMTEQVVQEFPGRTFHFKKRNCKKEPFPRLRKYALKKRGITVADDPPVKDSNVMELKSLQIAA